MNMRYVLTIMVCILTGPAHAIRGCFDLQGSSLTSGEPNQLGVSAYYYCGRGSGLYTLAIKFPEEFDEAALAYDASKKPDGDLYLNLLVHDWDAAEIDSQYRAESDIAKFMKPKFHGVLIDLSMRVARDLELSLYNSNACETIEVKGLTGWMAPN